ncbi:cysteine hydrolase family protein [Nitratireductor pacificus]|uniref:Isochorismatase hydrolase n=1 Tax=Nitratireductor pacificus pht-3B TaxID=391937 RepID=K2LRL0_9HYPH|nr:cysteine hydrolase family protein [Nitratireductor pacificus]EKF20409.1 isochorismatase hydrolase [Nitratireductor pacificus pht-3B]
MNLDGAVLLLVDYQQAFDHAPWPRRWNGDVDRNGKTLLAAWRAAGRPVIHVRHDSVEPGSTLRPGQPGNALRPGFEPLAGEELVSKSVNSAFIGTDLDLRLRRLGAKQVVACGISTDMCVSTTIRTGANMGWPMTLVADACDCFDLPDGKGGTVPAEAVQAAHVATLGFDFCTVTDTQALVAALEGN